MKSQLSISEVKNKLTALIHEIEEGGSVQVTRHGKIVAVLLSVDEYKGLIGKKEGFWERYRSFRHQVSEKNKEMDDTVFDSVRDRSIGRGFEFE